MGRLEQSAFRLSRHGRAMGRSLHSDGSVARSLSHVAFRRVLHVAQSPPVYPRRRMNAVVLWVAQGFGAGRIPFAPGTFGSLVGILWFYLLLRTGNFWIYAAGPFV